MSGSPVTESDLQSYVDGRLPATRAAEVAQHLALNEELASQVAAWRNQNAALQTAYDPVIIAPVPARLQAAARGKRRGVLIQYAVAAGLMVISGVAGWHLHGVVAADQAQTVYLVRNAAVAHAVYTPEVRHPVEVGADQEEHLVRWLSKRLGSTLKIPHLAPQGYALVGGRLLTDERGPAAHFMYQDVKGQRLTLYVRVNNIVRAPTAFHFSQEKGISVFYWLDGRLGYALSGDTPRSELLRVADAVYQQLNP